MKNYLITAFLITISPFTVCAETPTASAVQAFQKPSDPQESLPTEVQKLDIAINAAQDTLNALQSIRQQITEYQNLQQQYVKHPENKEQLFYLVKLASRLQDNVKTYHLSHYLSSEFLNELALFAHIGNKKGIPKVSP